MATFTININENVNIDSQITTATVSTACDSGMVVRVTVPAGETRTVSVIKTGSANYVGVNSSGITADIIPLVDVVEQVISTTTSYGLILDAEPGDGSGSSSITISTVGGNSIQLNRTHHSTPTFC
jgi:hypothetical protein